MVPRIKFSFWVYFICALVAAPLVSQETRHPLPDKGAKSVSTKEASSVIEKKFQGVQDEIRKNNSGESETELRQSEFTTKKTTGLFIKMICGMIFIVLLIVLSIRWLKSLQNSSLLGKKNKTTNRLEVLETCYLGKDQKIILVNMGDKEVALGVTSNSIQLLKELGERKNIESATDLEPSGQQLTNFKDNLNSFLNKYSRPKTVAQTLEEL